MASVTHSIENSPTQTISQTSHIKEESITIGLSWKAILRKKNQTKRPNQKLTPRLSESIKSKNIPKNVAKAIIQQILNNNVQEQIEEQEQFLKFINKHRKIQNLACLMKITRPHKLERLNKLHKQFRQIWYVIDVYILQLEFSKKVNQKSRRPSTIQESINESVCSKIMIQYMYDFNNKSIHLVIQVLICDPKEQKTKNLLISYLLIYIFVAYNEESILINNNILEQHFFHKQNNQIQIIMFFKLVMKVGIQSMKYQIRPSIAAFRTLANNHLNLHNLNTFYLNQLTRFAEEEESDINEVNLINCLSEVKSLNGI